MFSRIDGALEGVADRNVKYHRDLEYGISSHTERKTAAVADSIGGFFFFSEMPRQLLILVSTHRLLTVVVENIPSPM